MPDDKHETLVQHDRPADALAGISNDIEAAKKLYAEINAAERASLQEIENREKSSTTEANDVTPQPEPNT